MALEASIERRIRNQIPDADAVFGENQDEYLFNTVSIEDFYTDAREAHPLSSPVVNILRAAAYANQVLATSEALISKSIRTQDLTTNGAVVATAILARAKELMDRADALDYRAALDYFEIVDYQEGWSVDRPELTEQGITG